HLLSQPPRTGTRRRGTCEPLTNPGRFMRTVNSRVSVVRIASSLELFHGDAVCLHRTFRTRLPDRHCRTRRGHRRQLQGRWLYLWEKYDSWRVRWTYTVFPPPRG